MIFAAAFLIAAALAEGTSNGEQLLPDGPFHAANNDLINFNNEGIFLLTQSEGKTEVTERSLFVFNLMDSFNDSLDGITGQLPNVNIGMCSECILCDVLDIYVELHFRKELTINYRL